MHMINNYRCFLLLADRVNSLQTPVIIDRSVEENSQSIESTSTISLSSETEEQIFSKETSMQKREINTNYLLAGAGAVIFMLLFIIVIQTCRKSKSAKGNFYFNTNVMKIKQVMKPSNDHQMAAVKII